MGLDISYEPTFADQVGKPSLSLLDAAQKLLAANASWAIDKNHPTTITWSFRESAVSVPDRTTFDKYLSEDLKQDIRTALNAWASVANINFVEINPGGYTNNATMLFGGYKYSPLDDQIPSIWASGNIPYTKNTSAASGEGDVWINLTLDQPFDRLKTMIHEIGHALGLSHPGNYNGAGNIYRESAEFKQDTDQYTVMSYFEGWITGFGSGQIKSPMILDIIAIQKLYGENTSYNNGNNSYVFRWDSTITDIPTRFCIYDTGGIDTIDADQTLRVTFGAGKGEGFSRSQISLEPGSSSHTVSTDFSIALGSLIENVVTGSGDDIVEGNSAPNNIRTGNGSDKIEGKAGNDSIDGGSGVDYAHYKGTKNQYIIEKNGNVVIIKDSQIDRDGVDTLINIEFLTFSDGTISISSNASMRTDINGNAGQAYRLYQAALDRTPDERGLADWINYMDNGGQLKAVSQMFIDSFEFRTKYGALDNLNFINQLYQNILDRAGEAKGVSDWVGALNNGSWSRAQVLVGFSESPENQANVIGQIKNGIRYVEYWLS